MGLRSLARRVLAVSRKPVYYLPWLIRPGLQCVLVLSNVESRFKVGYNQGPFPLAVVQYDANGAPSRRYQLSLESAEDTVELALDSAPGGCGFVTVEGDRINSDLYATLSHEASYTATHGRGEFTETYPLHARVLLALAQAALGLMGRALPAFIRDQYVYVGQDSCSHLLLLNLSNVPNRIRVAASVDGRAIGIRLLRLAPMGSALLDVLTLGTRPDRGTAVWRLRLQGAAWFNLYVLGAGSRDLSGPLALMHVK
jgi:hypothetical protein